MYRLIKVRPIIFLMMMLNIVLMVQPTLAAECTNLETPALAPEWVAVRQQYDPRYQPLINRMSAVSETRLAPEWVAVRQQYDPRYQPSSHSASSLSAGASRCLSGEIT